MNRRTFIQGLAGAATGKRVALTFDDVAWRGIPGRWQAGADAALRAALPGQAALFVTGMNVDNAQGASILRAWSKAGHILGNHTWDHVGYASASISPEQFQAGILRCDDLLRSYEGFQRLFRFPQLKEGQTVERRDAMRMWMHEHGYRNGYVTIDASDWYYDARLRQRLQREPEFDVTRFRRPYLDHILDRAQYYDSLARRAVGHGIPHTLLLHYNLINSLFLGDLVAELRQQDWRVIDAGEAFADPVFRREPAIAPAGESLVWALAKETGRFDGELHYPGEDDVYEKPLLDRLGL